MTDSFLIRWEVLNLNRCLIVQSGFRHRFSATLFVIHWNNYKILFKSCLSQRKTQKTLSDLNLSLSRTFMADRKRIVAKCQELVISLGSRTRLEVIKRRLNDLGVDWTVASTTAPTAPVSNVISLTSPSIL